MKSFRRLWGYIILFSLVIFVFLLLIYSIVINMQNKDPTSLIQNLTTQFSIITALFLPFIIKGIDRKEKEKVEKEIVIRIIERVKDYLKYLISPTKDNRYYRFSSSMPFFFFIYQKLPMIMAKIRIEIYQKEEERGIQPFEPKFIDRSLELYILDKYIISLGPACKLISIEQDKEIKPNKEKFEKVLRELRDHINDVFSFKISKDLAKF